MVRFNWLWLLEYQTCPTPPPYFLFLQTFVLSNSNRIPETYRKTIYSWNIDWIKLLRYDLSLHTLEKLLCTSETAKEWRKMVAQFGKMHARFLLQTPKAENSSVCTEWVKRFLISKNVKLNIKVGPIHRIGFFVTLIVLSERISRKTVSNYWCIFNLGWSNLFRIVSSVLKWFLINHNNSQIYVVLQTNRIGDYESGICKNGIVYFKADLNFIYLDLSNKILSCFCIQYNSCKNWYDNRGF